MQDNNQFYTVMWKKNTQTYWQAGKPFKQQLKNLIFYLISAGLKFPNQLFEKVAPPRGECVGHAFPSCGRAGHPAQARPIRNRPRWEAKQVSRPISDRDYADNKIIEQLGGNRCNKTAKF